MNLDNIKKEESKKNDFQQESKNELRDENESIPTENTLVIKYGSTIIILGLIALIIILIGLFYWWNSLTNPTATPAITPERPSAETNKEPESANARAQTDSFNAMSTSDEIYTIEADLESTNLNTLDNELNAIEAELGTID